MFRFLDLRFHVAVGWIIKIHSRLFAKLIFHRAGVLGILLVALLSGCASSGGKESFEQKVQRVAEHEAGILSASEKPLSSFSDYRLGKMTFDSKITAGEKKQVEAREFEQRFRAKVEPLLEQWRNTDDGGEGRLLIQVHLQRLRIVSGGLRFVTGALAGESFITIDMKLVDETTGDIISDLTIDERSGAIAGGFSIGASDQNIDYYLVATVRQYLLNNY